MSKIRLYIIGIILAAVGFIGEIMASQYFENNPGESIGKEVLEIFGAKEQASTEVQIYSFFNEYGVYIGIAGLVVIAVAFAFKGRKG